MKRTVLIDEKITEDFELIDSALRGEASALERLIRKHQTWVYNLAVYMIGDVFEAEDLTQEVMIKMMTGLASFKKQSAFSTWLYRICVNAVYDYRKKTMSKRSLSFEQYSEMLESAPDSELDPMLYSSEEQRLISEEVKSQCLLGMLLCLTMDQRVLIVLADVLSLSGKVIGQILGIHSIVLRKRLQRARLQLYHFMNEECGLVDPANSCHCKLKAKSMINNGLIDKERLVFHKQGYATLHSMIPQKQKEFAEFYDEKCAELLSSRPFDTGYDFVPKLRDIIGSTRFSEVMSFKLQ